MSDHNSSDAKLNYRNFIPVMSAVAYEKREVQITSKLPPCLLQYSSYSIINKTTIPGNHLHTRLQFDNLRLYSEKSLTVRTHSDLPQFSPH